MQNKDFKFQEIAIELFNWLEDYGYSLIEENLTIVKYKGPRGDVSVYRGRSSYEIGVEVGPPHKEQKIRYSMSELIRLIDGDEANNYRNPVVSSPNSMKRLMSDQAQRLRKYGERIFMGDVNIWKDLEEQRQKWSKDYAMDVLLSRARREVEDSFRKKDYKRVVELLSRVESGLTQAERKKLEYAKHKLGP